MSLASIKPYFSSKLSGFGYTEWNDGFGEDNIPSNLIDKAFHQRVLSINAASINQESYEMLVNHQIKIFFKGFNDPALAIDESLVASQSIISSCLKLSDYTQAGIKGLFFDQMSIDPYDDQANDNVVVATLQFSVRVFNCIG